MTQSAGTRGRKRSAAAENAVLAAAYDLLATEGLQATTVEAIAQRAKVSKATIYKWWPNRAAVIMSAFLREASNALPYPQQLDMTSIFDRLHRMAGEFHGPIGNMVRALIAEGQSDPEIAQAFREGYVLARRQEGVAIVRAAIAAGLIREADPDVILDMLYAPLYYRLLVGHQPLTAEFVREHVTLALNGLATGRG
jgi:AcrR family transcriptional regulator